MIVSGSGSGGGGGSGGSGGGGGNSSASRIVGDSGGAGRMDEWGKRWPTIGLKLFVGTFNVGGTLPPSSNGELQKWLPLPSAGYRVYAIGLQEEGKVRVPFIFPFILRH